MSLIDFLTEVPIKLSSPMLIAEIQYFMAFSALKKMVEKEKVTMEDARKMNLLLAERFGVRRYEI